MKRVLVALAVLVGMGGAAAPLTGTTLFAQMLNSANGSQWRALERTFPQEVHAYFASMAAKLNKQGFSPQLTAETVQWETALVRSNQHYSSNAPDQDLAAFGRAQAALLDSLRAESVENCAYMVLHPLLPPGPHSPRTVEAFRALALAQLDLIRSGRDTPQVHGALGVEDIKVLNEKALEFGAAGPALDAVVDGKLLSLAPAVQCKTLTELLRAASALPPGPGGRYLARTVAAEQEAAGPGGFSPALLLKQFEDGAGFGAAFKRFEKAYPEESAALGKRLAADMASGHGGFAQPFADTLRSVMKSTDAARSAPDDRLIALLQAQILVFDELDKRDPVACADRIAGRASLKTGITSVSANNDVFTRAMLDLLTDARLKRTPHEAVRTEDVDAVRRAMSDGGLTPLAVDASLAGMVVNLPAADQCHTQITMWRAIVQMPPDAAGRMAAQIFSN